MMTDEQIAAEQIAAFRRRMEMEPSYPTVPKAEVLALLDHMAALRADRDEARAIARRLRESAYHTTHLANVPCPICQAQDDFDALLWAKEPPA